MSQNRPKIGLRGQKSTAKTQLTETATKYPAGAQCMAYLCGLWAAGHQIWPQRGLKAPFAAKFGMDLGVLAVFLGPVCHQMPAKMGSKALKGSQNGSKWLKTGSKWPKMAQNGPK